LEERLTVLNGYEWDKIHEWDERLLAGSVDEEEIIIPAVGFPELIKMAAHAGPPQIQKVLGTFDLIVIPVGSKITQRKKKMCILVEKRKT
jgi:hypothetical protein